MKKTAESTSGEKTQEEMEEDEIFVDARPQFSYVAMSTIELPQMPEFDRTDVNVWLHRLTAQLRLIGAKTEVERYHCLLCYVDQDMLEVLDQQINEAALSFTSTPYSDAVKFISDNFALSSQQLLRKLLSMKPKENDIPSSFLRRLKRTAGHIHAELVREIWVESLPDYMISALPLLGDISLDDIAARVDAIHKMVSRKRKYSSHSVSSEVEAAPIPVLNQTEDLHFVRESLVHQLYQQSANSLPHQPSTRFPNQQGIGCPKFLSKLLIDTSKVASNVTRMEPQTSELTTAITEGDRETPSANITFALCEILADETQLPRAPKHAGKTSVKMTPRSCDSRPAVMQATSLKKKECSLVAQQPTVTLAKLKTPAQLPKNILSNHMTLVKQIYARVTQKLGHAVTRVVRNTSLFRRPVILRHPRNPKFPFLTGRISVDDDKFSYWPDKLLCRVNKHLSLDRIKAPTYVEFRAWNPFEEPIRPPEVPTRDISVAPLWSIMSRHLRTPYWLT